MAKRPDYIAQAITGWWGKRCPDFNEHCNCCQAWQQYDRLREVEARAREIIRDGLDAASAAYEQAQAEYHDHEKTAERKDAVVRKFRNAARAFLHDGGKDG